MQTKEMDSVEKNLLDIFNYYNREHKPFRIEKVYKENNEASVEPIKTEFKNKLFNINKEKREERVKIEESNNIPSINTIVLDKKFEEFRRKADLVNEKLLSSNYDYDSNKTQFSQHLLYSLYSISTNYYDYSVVYNIYFDFYKVLNDQFKESLSFWEEFFSKEISTGFIQSDMNLN